MELKEVKAIYKNSNDKEIPCTIVNAIGTDIVVIRYQGQTEVLDYTSSFLSGKLIVCDPLLRKRVEDEILGKSNIVISKTPVSNNNPSILQFNLSKSYGTKAIDVYDDMCSRFSGWIKSERGKFAPQKKLFGIRVADGIYNVWFVGHSNWTGTSADKWTNVISGNCDEIIEYHNQPIPREDAYFEKYPRITFAKRDGEYYFLGIYDTEVDFIKRTKHHTRLSKVYPMQEQDSGVRYSRDIIQSMAPVKDVKYKKCPICELNWIREDEDVCALCGKSHNKYGNFNKGGATANYPMYITIKDGNNFVKPFMGNPGCDGYPVYTDSGVYIGVVHHLYLGSPREEDRAEIRHSNSYVNELGYWHRLSTYAGQLKWSEVERHIKEDGEWRLLVI